MQSNTITIHSTTTRFQNCEKVESVNILLILSHKHTILSVMKVWIIVRLLHWTASRCITTGVLSDVCILIEKEKANLCFCFYKSWIHNRVNQWLWWLLSVLKSVSWAPVLIKGTMLPSCGHENRRVKQLSPHSVYRAQTRLMWMWNKRNSSSIYNCNDERYWMR